MTAINPCRGIPLACMLALGLTAPRPFAQSFDPHPIAGSNALTKPHPGYDLADLFPANSADLPSGYSGHVTGMAFLPDGRLALADLPNSEQSAQWKGSVWILDGVQTGDKGKVTFKQFLGNLYAPTGLVAVAGDLYVIDANSLKRLKDNNGTAAVTEVTGSWHQTGGQPAVSDLVYQNGFFYSSISSAGMSVNGTSISGGTIKIAANGAVERLSTGYRNTGGAGINSKGEIFATDNQGEWLPSNKLIHVVPGRYYGFGGPKTGVTTYPPAVWIPEGVVSPPNGNASTFAAGNSPGTVLPIDTGVYAGQVLVGDIRYGNVHRAFLEKIQGEYQGALFHFSGGFRAGIFRMAWGPDGALYLGGMGGNFYTWSWKDNRVDDDWGLHRLKPNGKSVFEIVAVRAKAGGFELRFTQPVDAKVAAGNFKVQTWRYVSTGNYGGPQVDMTTRPVQSVQMSADKASIFLNIPGLAEGQVVHIELDSNAVVSSTGAKPWTFETWYTLNKLSSEPPLSNQDAQPRILPGRFLARSAANGAIRIESDFGGRYQIRDARGFVLEEGAVEAGRMRDSSRRYGAGLYFVTVGGLRSVPVIRL